jgi:hypothetical protein
MRMTDFTHVLHFVVLMNNVGPTPFKFTDLIKSGIIQIQIINIIIIVRIYYKNTVISNKLTQWRTLKSLNLPKNYSPFTEPKRSLTRDYHCPYSE